jgi:hypothetical protein
MDPQPSTHARCSVEIASPSIATSGSSPQRARTNNTSERSGSPVGIACPVALADERGWTNAQQVMVEVSQ